MYLDFSDSCIVVDVDSLDLSLAVRRGAGGGQEVPVRPYHAVSFELPPAGRVVGDATTLAALETHMTFVLYTHTHTQDNVLL